MDEVVFEIARTIRAYLPGLVGDRAADIDRRLVDLLAQARSGADVNHAILDVLAESPETHSWAASMLVDAGHRPPDLQARTVRSGGEPRYSGLPNPHGGDPVDADRYVCPTDGAYVWWRMSVGQPIPDCRDHPGTALIPG